MSTYHQHDSLSRHAIDESHDLSNFLYMPNPICKPQSLIPSRFIPVQTSRMRKFIYKSHSASFQCVSNTHSTTKNEATLVQIGPDCPVVFCRGPTSILVVLTFKG